MPKRQIIVRGGALGALLLAAAWTTPYAPSLTPRAFVRVSAASAIPPDSKSDAFFGLTHVSTFELTIAAADFDRMPPPNGRGGRGMPGGRFALPIDDSGYPKVPATLRFDGQDWGAIHVRYKGNSSYRGAPSVLKRSLKLEFDDADTKRTFFGLSKLNLNNNAFDGSQMREALAYELFRGAGVPAPRTAFARVFLTVPGRYDHEYAGLFTAIEQIDQTFFADRFGRKVGLLVKPEGLRGMPAFGDDWKSYAEPYASKVNAKAADAERFVAFVKFVNSATDEEFARRIGDYLDVDEFLRFLAGEVLLVNSDSPLAMNHNYWITVHPDTHKVLWLPWDMNMAFGGFRSGGVDLAIHRPSSPGMFLLADRMLAVPAFVRQYDRLLLEMTTGMGQLVEDLQRVTPAIRDAVAAETSTTLERFEQNVAEHPADSTDRGGGGFFGPGRSGPPLRQFLTDRLESVRGQLDGTQQGTPGAGGRGGFGGFPGPPPPPPRIQAR